MIFNMK